MSPEKSSKRIEELHGRLIKLQIIVINRGYYGDLRAEIKTLRKSIISHFSKLKKQHNQGLTKI